MKKMLTMLLTAATLAAMGCAASSIQVVRFDTPKKAFTVNFFYEQGSDIRVYNTYYVHTGQGRSTDETVGLITSMLVQHSFDRDDQKNLKLSFVKTLLLNKTFKHINLVSSRDEMKAKDAKYDIVVTYFGGSVGGRWTVKIALGYQIIDKAKNKVIFSKVQIIEESSFIKNLNGVKNACIETALESLFTYIKQTI